MIQADYIGRLMPSRFPFLFSLRPLKAFGNLRQEKLLTAKGAKQVAKRAKNFVRSPVPPMVRRVFHRLCAAACALESDLDVESNGDSQPRLKSAGVFIAGGKPGRDSLVVWFPLPGAADCGVLAWHLVTELRATHGSVGADEK